MTKRVRFPLVLLLTLVLTGPFGCASKKIKIYDAESAIQARSSVVEYAITLLGKPYRNGAKGPQAFDCSGLVHHVYGQFDMIMPVSTEGLVRLDMKYRRTIWQPETLRFSASREICTSE